MQRAIVVATAISYQDTIFSSLRYYYRAGCHDNICLDTVDISGDRALNHIFICSLVKAAKNNVVLVLNVLKPKLVLITFKNQAVPQRKHNTSPLQRSTG
jgi:hypothetical protein